MVKKIINFWSDIRSSLWFLPALMVVATVILAWITIYYDGEFYHFEYLPKWVAYKGGLEGARALLTTIAGSMITVAGVTFSITIVALTLASSQLGPRLLRNFMRDARNQAVLGTFIATYLYCLLILRIIEGPSHEGFIPHISLLMAMVFAITNLAVLIYFIHHISVSIQADHVIALICNDIENTFTKRFATRKNDFKRSKTAKDSIDSYTKDCKAYSLTIQRSGYIKDIDVESVFSFSLENDCFIKIEHRPGDYIVPNHPLLHVFAKNTLEDEKIQSLQTAFILGKDRASDQDIEYSVNQLVEIALRALSPGINDPFTAITCIDRLSTAIILFMEKADNTPYIYDKQGNLRVVENLTTFAGIVDTALHQIRQTASHNPAIVIRLIERIQDISLQTNDQQKKDVLLEHLNMLKNKADDSFKEKRDLEDVEKRYKIVVKVLKSTNEVL